MEYTEDELKTFDDCAAEFVKLRDALEAEKIAHKERVQAIKDAAVETLLTIPSRIPERDLFLALISVLYFHSKELLTVTSLSSVCGNHDQIAFKKLMQQNYPIGTICEDCGEEFAIHDMDRQPSKWKRAKGNSKVCQACQIVRDENAKQKTDAWFAEQHRKQQEQLTNLRTMPYKEYLQTEHWVTTRKRAMKRAGFKCQLCSSKQNIQVHHRTYENRGNEQNEDLIVLCRSCHQKFHDIVEE